MDEEVDTGAMLGGLLVLRDDSEGKNGDQGSEGKYEDPGGKDGRGEGGDEGGEDGDGGGEGGDGRGEGHDGGGEGSDVGGGFEPLGFPNSTRVLGMQNVSGFELEPTREPEPKEQPEPMKKREQDGEPRRTKSGTSWPGREQVC